MQCSELVAGSSRIAVVWTGLQGTLSEGGLSRILQLCKRDQDKSKSERDDSFCKTLSNILT